MKLKSRRWAGVRRREGGRNIQLSPTGTPAIECRSGGNYKVVFTFANNLVSVASASLTRATGSVSSSAIGPNPNQYTVNHTGGNSCNAQYVTVMLNNVNDSAGDHSDSVLSPECGMLLGDVTASGVVSNTDVSSVKGQVGAAVGSSNFRNDVSTNGIISNTDVSTTKGQVGTTLP